MKIKTAIIFGFIGAVFLYMTQMPLQNAKSNFGSYLSPLGFNSEWIQSSSIDIIVAILALLLLVVPLIIILCKVIQNRLLGGKLMYIPGIILIVIGITWVIVVYLNSAPPSEKEKPRVEKKQNQEVNRKATDFKLLLRGGNVFMHKSRPGITGMALGVQIRNAGRASSIATNWKLYIKELGKAPVLAQLINTPKELPPIVSAVDFSLREEAISKPIEYGDVLEGTLLFYIELPRDNVIKEDTNIELKVDDIHGKTFSAIQNMGDWPIKKIKEEVMESKKPKTLYDYFENDFGLLAVRSSVKLSKPNSNETTAIEYNLHMDTVSNSKFISYYVPPFPSSIKTYENILALINAHIVAFDHVSKKYTIDSHSPGDSSYVYSKNLKFSGKIYIYHAGELTLEQKGEISRQYKGKGLALQLRDQDYATMQNLSK